MNKPLHTLDLDLAPGELLRWRPAAAIELQLLAGRAWVTQAGDEDDHFLGAGDTLRLCPGALALVEAEGPLRLRLLAPQGTALQPRGALRQWLQRLAGRGARAATVAG